VPDHASDELDRLREENAGLRQQVRRLRARGGEADLGYLFVITYGRSGSTLVAGLLNALPGYLIRGENRDAVHHLFRYHQTLLAESERASRTKLRMKTHPFFGIGDFPAPRSLAGIRRLVLETVLRPKADTRVTGFKEIRWYHEDLEEYVAWLREVFPGARFLVNTRAHADVLSSKWWAKGDPQHNAEHLAVIERRILAVADHLGEAAYRIHYDDYVADPTVLRGLFDWLGEPWDEDAVRSVLAIRHSV
jgi:hypothetical protein